MRNVCLRPLPFMLIQAGYSRILLAIVSLHYMPFHPRTCSLCSLSCLLDALDDAAARIFEQQPNLGACWTWLWIVVVFLASAFSRWSILFQGLISLDFASHYMHVYATLVMGGSSVSHKEMGEGRPWAMRLYYSNTVGLIVEVWWVELTGCTGSSSLSVLLTSSSSLRYTFSPCPRLSSCHPRSRRTAESSSKYPGSHAVSSQIWTRPWSAGAMEVGR